MPPLTEILSSNSVVLTIGMCIYYCLFNNAFNNSCCIMLNDGMSNELGSMWKETLWSSF
jgi:hypothetical protein